MRVTQQLAGSISRRWWLFSQLVSQSVNGDWSVIQSVSQSLSNQRCLLYQLTRRESIFSKIFEVFLRAVFSEVNVHDELQLSGFMRRHLLKTTQN